MEEIKNTYSNIITTQAYFEANDFLTNAEEGKSEETGSNIVTTQTYLD